MMATSNITKRGKKVFTFKKRESPPAEEVLVLDDDDDDDFKPSKYPFPGKTVVGDGEVSVVSVKQFPQAGKSQQKASVKTHNKKQSTIVQRVVHRNSGFVFDDDEDDDSVNATSKAVLSVSEDLERVEVGVVEEKEIEEVLLDEQGNCDVEVLAEVTSSFPGSSNTEESKGAWKNLMSQMQKNQKESVRNAAKKGKVSTKRGLVQSPKPKVASSLKDHVPSPVKKNARLGSGEITVSSSALKEFKNGTGLGMGSQPKPSLAQCSGTQSSSKENSEKAPTKVAPIFLPPAERKALEKTSAVKNHVTHALECMVDFGSEYEDSNAPEDPEHFNGNVVILNQDQPEKDPYAGNKTKVCPFYKKLPGTVFCVDAFNYGLIPGMEVYFLSHFHSDHYIGLSKKFCKTVICSHPTGNLVKMKLYVEEKCIRKLRMNKPYLICDSEVTLVDANHCPGSVMFIFRFKTGAVTLHTGDFRYTPNMLTCPHMSELLIDHLYLDTTYCNPQYDFPTQNESVATVISQVKRHLEFRPQTLIVCGSYLIGKERVYFTLAEAIGAKVFGTYDKRKIINALENKKFTALLSAGENSSQIHVVPMFSISAKNLQEYLAKYPQYTNIIGIKPSGWQFSSCGSGCSVRTHYNGTVTVLGVPYSEHSSFSELKEFVTNLRPKRVQPTVNVGNAKKREEMMQHIESWLSM